ncbi:hypothetical protein D9757_002045 [Collybiopsis confluens]|uniref:Uncharacterized protein n=1 Tax=Collybiopsis confluens TaxID=2823264 RepID=A0A8H5HXJ3_9AGAR|nr:hypothetical protein D9757_002045 [Collybiopsis confluens]
MEVSLRPAAGPCAIAGSLFTMGNATSKTARKLPKRAHPPSGSQRVAAREVKDQAIQDDAQDPDFMSNLSRLGVVNVDHNMKTVRPHEKARKMIERRIESEEQAASMHATRNHVQASTLTYLLDQRKSNISEQELASLTDKYGMDIEKLEGVSAHIASPSISGESVVRRVRNEDGEEEVAAMAIWVKR